MISEEFRNVYNIDQIKFVDEKYCPKKIGGKRCSIMEPNLYRFDFNYVSKKNAKMVHMIYDTIIQNPVISIENFKRVNSCRVTRGHVYCVVKMMNGLNECKKSLLLISGESNVSRVIRCVFNEVSRDIFNVFFGGRYLA